MAAACLPSSVQVVLQPPVGQEQAAAPGVALAAGLGILNPVETEMAKVLAEFAPSGQHFRRLEEADRDRPDGPDGGPVLLV
jgi:hypothetical protein